MYTNESSLKKQKKDGINEFNEKKSEAARGRVHDSASK